MIPIARSAGTVLAALAVAFAAPGCGREAKTSRAGRPWRSPCRRRMRTRPCSAVRPP
ncbi:MAG: hypothetical protein M0C28_00975 [Candidatus Moduliflexus flocculans]|nr:hypothetical protein [Candidatus Moduliflexus flocculans]